MPSSKEYLDYIMDGLSLLPGVASKKMMGEFILYYKGRIIGGIYDDRFLVKPVAAAKKLLPNACEELPYEGAKPMLLVDNTDDRDFLFELITEMYPELPEPKKRKNK